jgi:integral membrane protein (TIGR01906 family)
MTQTHQPVSSIVRLILWVCTPLVLLLSNLYIVATPAFIRYEYGKPGFPLADVYDDAERLRLAQATLHYLRSNVGVEYLTNLESHGQVAYNPREIKHLVDVKWVMNAAFWVHAVSALLCALAIAFSWRRTARRSGTLLALSQGCWALLFALLAIGIVAYVSFDVFFVFFHRVFFSGDSWLFAFTDTLIQLFPVQFWMDATWALALLAIAEAIVLGLATGLWARRWQRA